ncbi:endospore biogenesis thiol-disulfide oxidoreductase StoA [Bacillus sp. NPDC077027]|uniref:endospore biogenesis thiol-disulfide oxidoreductase StoA n=1 Tax=Bacillus sp. NPDC077027 TaxID=3390548 RepID=UPI003D02CD31
MNIKRLSTVMLVLMLLSSLIHLPAMANEKPVVKRAEMPTLSGGKQVIPIPGKRTILHFWTTWCPSCKMELPIFQQMTKEKTEEVEIITVNLLSAEQSKSAVSQFIKDRKFTFPIVLDERGELMKTFQIITIPTTFLINEKGEVEKNHVGPLTKKQIKEWAAS